MGPSSQKLSGAGTRRILRLAAAAGSAAIVLSILLFWLNDQMATPAYWRASLVFLAVLEWAYLGTVAGILVAMPPLAWLALRRRRTGARRTALSRALLAVASMAISLALAESITAAWLERSRRSTVVPVGGSGRGAQVDRQMMWPPLSLDDVPLPESFPVRTSDGAIELVIVGESSAQGVPYSAWLSIGQLVAWQLEEVIPGRRVRLQMLATSGDTLETQHQRLASMPRRPDLMIVYCGHNEFGSRFHGAREIVPYDDDRTPTGWRLVRERAEAVSPLCELIRRTSERCRLEEPPAGHRDLIDTPAFTTDEYRLLLADFRRRLETIVSYAGRIGTTVVLIVPPGNDAGFEPNRSFLPAATPRSEREAFRSDFLEARRLEDTDPPAAIEAFRRLIARQPSFAESHYRLGVLLDRSGDAEGAYREFVASRDRDGFPIRCTSAFQDVYREVAAQHAAILVDGQAELHAIGRRGLLDDRLFQDAMHPSLRGQIALAQAVLRELRAHHAFGWPQGTPAPIIDPSRCAARFGLGLDAWKKLCLWGIQFATYAQGLRHDPAPRLQRKSAHAAAYERLVAGEAVEALGLPNVGIPEPVPAVTDTDPTRVTRSQPP
jgi:lysophospholipase L1-like esterase